MHLSLGCKKKEKNTKLYPVLGSVCVCSPRAATTCRSKSNSPGRRTCCCAAVGLLGLMLEGQPAGRGPESLCVCWEGKRARRKKNWGGGGANLGWHEFTSLGWKISVDFSDMLRGSNVMLMLAGSASGYAAQNRAITTKQDETPGSGA